MASWLLVLRVVVGSLLMGSGARKLFGRFGGGGLTATAWFFRSVGYRSPRRMARLAGGAELASGAAFTIGLGIPVAAAAALAGGLNAAVAVRTRNRRLGIAGGYATPVGMALMAITLGFSGAGPVSLDATLGISDGGAAAGAFAVALGLTVGVGLLSGRGRPRSVLALAPSSRLSPVVPPPRFAGLHQEGDP